MPAVHVHSACIEAFHFWEHSKSCEFDSIVDLLDDWFPANGQISRSDKLVSLTVTPT